MSLHDQYPAYGGRGPTDLRLGITLAVIATLFMVMRVYVRLRINKFGTSALIWSLVAWVRYSELYPCPMVILTINVQLFTAITQIFGILSVLHGLGNHISIIMKVGELHNFLLFTWVTVFFFNLAIPTGKVAVAVFLIEMNGQGSEWLRGRPHRTWQLTHVFFTRSQDPQKSHRRCRSEHHPQYPPGPHGLVPMHTGQRALGSSSPGSMQPRKKRILYLLCRCHCCFV